MAPAVASALFQRSVMFEFGAAIDAWLRLSAPLASFLMLIATGALKGLDPTIGTPEASRATTVSGNDCTFPSASAWIVCGSTAMLAGIPLSDTGWWTVDPAAAETAIVPLASAVPVASREANVLMAKTRSLPAVAVTGMLHAIGIVVSVEQFGAPVAMVALTGFATLGVCGVACCVICREPVAGETNARRRFANCPFVDPGTTIEKMTVAVAAGAELGEVFTAPFIGVDVGTPTWPPLHAESPKSARTIPD